MHDIFLEPGPPNWKLLTPQHMHPGEVDQGSGFAACVEYELPCLIVRHRDNLG